MTTKLQLTRQELEDLVSGRLDDRFEEIFDDIPMYHPDHIMEKGETHRNYMEDDGREYRWYICKDTVTDIEHCINYTYNPEWPNDVMDVPDSIEIVKESVISPKKEPVPEPKPVLTPEQQADNELMDAYYAVKPECRVFDAKEKIDVPKETIQDVLDFMKSEKFSIFQLRAKLIPICIKYKLNDKSFWTWIQVKRKAWKA
jgi:hypothetical protein